jgi:hypothetical protein
MLSFIAAGATGGPGPASHVSDAPVGAVASAARTDLPATDEHPGSNGTPRNYSVQFSESGLTPHSIWWVDFRGQNTSSNGTAVPLVAVNGTYLYSIGSLSTLTPRPASGNLTVAGANQVIAIQFASPRVYQVNFTDSAIIMPAGTMWGVHVSGANGSYQGTAQVAAPPTPVSTVAFNLSNGSYTFSILLFGNMNYTAAPSSGGFNVTGSWLAVPIVFVQGPPTYQLQFGETGLPNGTVWSVDLAGNSTNSTTTFVNFYAPNGTYNFAVGVAANGEVATSPGGSTTVAGGPARVAVTFIPPPNTYPIIFTETGLAAGTVWAVSLNDTVIATTASSLMISETNGTYNYTVSAVTGYSSNPTGGLIVLAGAGVTMNVTFTSVSVQLYWVVFTESGLPANTPWSGTVVNVSMIIFVFNGTNGSLQEPNGSYALTINAPSGYIATFPSSFQVNGSSVGVAVNFTKSSTAPGKYYVTLIESGLPNGTTWGASLGGYNLSTTTTTLAFLVVNGTYAVAVGAVANYTANYSSPVAVNGSSISEGVQFTNSTYPVTFSEIGLPAGASWSMMATSLATGASVAGRSTSTSLTLRLSLGAYSLVATGPAGFHVALSTSTLTVSGATSATPTTTFSAPPGLVSPPPSTSILNMTTLAGLVIVVIAAAGAVFGYLRYRSGQWKAEGEKWVEEIRNEAPSTNEDPQRPT